MLLIFTSPSVVVGQHSLLPYYTVRIDSLLAYYTMGVRSDVPFYLDSLAGSVYIKYNSTTGHIEFAGAPITGFSVASDSSLRLEGAGSDTYMIYNSSNAKIEAYINGTKEWQLPAGNVVVVTNHDSLEAAIHYFTANFDTGIVYAPAGVYSVTDSIRWQFFRAGKAYWGFIGDPGGTVIKNVGSLLDSTRNMFDFVTSGVTGYTDSCIQTLVISGITFDHNDGGGTRFYWATGDSGGHALRTYRYDGGDNLNAWPDHGESQYPYWTTQFDWRDNFGNIIVTYGRILHVHVHDCFFQNSFGGALRFRPIRKGSAWTAAAENGQIINNSFYQIRGASIQILYNGVRQIAGNTFRWVGMAVYSATGGWSFKGNRIEEFDSCAVLAEDSNWMHVTNNVISEGAQSAIHLIGNCSGTITHNTILNLVADNAYLGSAWQDDTVASVIELEAHDTGSVLKFPRNLLIAGNIFQTHSTEYDMETRYFVEAKYDGVGLGATASAVDSVYGIIISHNSISYGLGTDLTLGLTNLDPTRNMITNNMVLTQSASEFHTSQMWFTPIDTIATAGGANRWILFAGIKGDTIFLPYREVGDTTGVW